MKKFIEPLIEILEINNTDIIETSSENVWDPDGIFDESADDVY